MDSVAGPCSQRPCRSCTLRSRYSASNCLVVQSPFPAMNPCCPLVLRSPVPEVEIHQCSQFEVDHCFPVLEAGSRLNCLRIDFLKESFRHSSSVVAAGSASGPGEGCPALLAVGVALGFVASVVEPILLVLGSDAGLVARRTTRESR